MAKKNQLGVPEKVDGNLRCSDYSAVLVAGSDNVRYLSGIDLPFLYGSGNQEPIVFWPKKGKPVLFCSSEVSGALAKASWLDRVVGVHDPRGWCGENISMLRDWIRKSTGSSATSRVGIDLDSMSTFLFQLLRNGLERIEWLDCSLWLRALRMQKTAQEIALLEDVAYRTDHAILGAAHHVLTTATRPEKGLAEIIRVHCLERGLDASGYHSVALGASGNHARYFWPLAPQFGVGGGKILQPGEFVRMEMTASQNGYWADAARMLTMGEPSPTQRGDFEALVNLRNTLLERLRPGVACNELYRAVKDRAIQTGVELVAELPLSHGIGISAYEHPFLNDSDTTELRTGMVLVFDPVVRGSDGTILRSKDTIVVTDSGCRISNWYKDWREPYIALDSYPHGGG